MTERNKIQQQVSHFQKKFDELETYSMAMESNRDHHERPDYTSRTNKTPGTLRSNASAVLIGEPRTQRHPIDAVIEDLKTENTQLKQQVRNYQNQINKIQGEKQIMYQSLNQMKLNNLGESVESHQLKSGFNTPATKVPMTSLKKNAAYRSDSSQKDKSEAIIEYLRAEISHQREKYKKLDIDFANFKAECNNYKAQLKADQAQRFSISDFMKELIRPCKDLIYQLCADPSVSESLFYKEDDKYHGLEGKYCLDLPKILNAATDRIVELRSIIEHKNEEKSQLHNEVLGLKQQFMIINNAYHS